MRAPPRVAGLWGLAEATVFFVVPDVLISWLAVARGWRTALAACLAAAMAAALGGFLVILAARADPAGVFGVIAALPAIDGAMMAATCERFAAGGFPEALRGAFTGVPYKIYAACLGAAEPGTGRAGAFVALTPALRLPRFLVAALVAAGLDALARPYLPARVRLGIVAGSWIVFYAAYWSVMP